MPNHRAPDEDPDWLPRPEEQFRDLPPEIRWELTRRHPTYQLAWQPARRHFRNGPFGAAGEPDLCFYASLLLGGIGVGGEPVDPATPAEQLLEGVGPEWLGGPVRPISIRATAILLYTLLPPNEREAIGEIFIRSASSEHAIAGDDEQSRLQALRGLDELKRLVSPSLDRFTDRPLYYVHMDASKRSIQADIGLEIDRHRARFPRVDQRTRTDSISDDLAVWDRREGWNGGGYDAAREMSLHSVSRDLGVPLTTVASRYKAAFRWVTGLDFTPERWMRLMGPLKLLSPDQALSRRAASVVRLLSSRSERPVPESTLQGQRPADADRAGVVTGRVVADHDLELVDLLIDLGDLANQGRSDEEIASRVGLTVELVAAIRQRLDEFRQL